MHSTRQYMLMVLEFYYWVTIRTITYACLTYDGIPKKITVGSQSTCTCKTRRKSTVYSIHVAR
jgi:hypothetical protein